MLDQRYVCGSCEGSGSYNTREYGSEDCSLCNGRGYLTKAYYDWLVELSQARLVWSEKKKEIERNYKPRIDKLTKTMNTKISKEYEKYNTWCKEHQSKIPDGYHRYC